MKKLLAFVGVFLCFTSAKGQYVEDALRYSQNFPSLTARSMAMGNAFTSLGGDFASSFINPAGLGLYRKSEFQFSPGMGYNSSGSDYAAQSGSDNIFQYINSSVGYTGTYNFNKDKGLVSASLAAGYNRLNNFYNNSIIQGTNPSSSFSDYFVEYASNNFLLPDELNPFYERLAYDAWVIDTMGTLDQYKSLVPVPIDQRKSIQTRGGTGEWSFGFGLNFSNVLYVGTGIGITQLNKEQVSVFSEYNRDNYWAFRSFSFTEELDVRGTGVNFKVGLMARLSKSIRLGATFHSPTFYGLEEVYYNTMYSEYDDSSFFIRPTNTQGDLLEAGVYRYHLNTPLKLAGGISYQLGKTGILTGDVEYIPYNAMKTSTDDDFNTLDDNALFDGVNNDIDNMYRPVLNVRLGSEFRFGNFSLRAGGGYFPSPYASGELNEKSDHFEITSGLGYRDRVFFFDLGFSGLFHTEKYNLYTSNNTDNIANLTLNQFRFIATMGIRL